MGARERAGTRPLTEQRPQTPDETLAHLRWPIRLTRLGMAAERALRAFWPAMTVLMAAIAPLLFGWHDSLPVEAVWVLAGLSVIGLVAALVWGALRFRWPGYLEATERVDASLPGRPISAIADIQATGRGDLASEAVWAAHQRRMAERTRTARPVEPDLRLASRDPFGLRYIALLLFVCGLLFGSVWRVGTIAEAMPGGGQQVATGPVWEGWVEPPAYTGKPSLYLADIPQGPLAVPKGSAVTLRLYGEPGALAVEETVSGRIPGDVAAASEPEQGFLIEQDGQLAIEGEGGRSWQISLIPDLPPQVALAGPVEAEATGEMVQPFRASDDYGVVAGRATIALDLDQVERAHGLTIEPEPREPLVLDLPMPFSGNRAEFEERLIDDLSEHPLANLPVTMTLTVADEAGQEGSTVPEELVLPGRRFFQPIARAVIEQRRDLLWNRENAARVTQLLRAVAHRPEGFFPNETTYLRLSFVIRQLAADLEDGTLEDATRDEVVQALWDLAIQLEDGTLADARERLARAQERLEEAMRNGASPEEIAELMQELREAMDEYMRMLAEQAPPPENQTDQPQTSDNSMEITRDELQALMDRIQELMEEGRMAEAMELMEQLNQLMENLQVTQGQGQMGPGQQSMEDLAETLRDQQELSDEAFRDLQDQFNNREPGQQGQGQPQGQQGQQPGQLGQGQQGGQNQQPGQQGQGQSPGDAPGRQFGQQGENGQGGEPGAGTLAERQEALRNELSRQRGNLPTLDGESARRAEEALGRAEGAMDQAEDALREGDLPEAIDRQADAMDALRDGMRALGEALAENRMDQPGQGQQQGNANGRLEPNRRDPLGREFGNTGQLGTEENMLQGEDIYRRAEELLQELRRRAGEQERPEQERQYLKRLLERF